MSALATLRLREELGLARRGEVVLGAVTLDPGSVGPHDRLVLRDPPGTERPCQVLTWSTTAAGQLVVAFAAAVDLAADADEDHTLAVGGPGEPLASPGPQTVQVVEADATVSVTTGAGVVRLAAGTHWLEAPHLLGPEAHLTARLDGLDTTVEVEALRVVHRGPVLAEVDLEGAYRAGAARVAGFHGRVRVTPDGALTLDVAVVADGPEPLARLDAWRLRLPVGPVEHVRVGAFQHVEESPPPVSLRADGTGHARGIFATSRVDGDGPWTDRSEAGYHERWEWSELTGRHGQNWLAVLGVDRAVTVAVERLTEHHPARLAALDTAVDVALLEGTSAGGGAGVVVTQGAAPRRRLRVTPGTEHAAGARLDTPVVSLQTDALARLAPSVLPHSPDRFPQLESRIRGELFGWCQQGQALGFYDHGDGVQGTTAGPRTGYSSNNEHDAVLALTLMYLRSGERAALDAAVAYADHTVDIDQVHASTHAHEIGGVRAHGHRHVHYVDAVGDGGPLRTSMDTGHVWVEGLVLLEQVTGEARYLEAARGVGRCLLGLEKLGWTRPEPGPRNAGWPLVALAALAARTGESAFLDAARRIAAGAVRAQAADGRWTMRLGYREDYCAWQNAVLLTGLARVDALVDDPVLRLSLERGGRALLDRGRTPEGTFTYLTRFDYRWAHRTGLVREALALLHEATGDEEYLRAGLVGGTRWYAPAGRPRTTSEEVAEWRGHLPFLGRAAGAGLLEDES